MFTQLTASRWESGHFHIGHFQDECFKMLPQGDSRVRWVDHLSSIIVFKPQEQRLSDEPEYNQVLLKSNQGWIEICVSNCTTSFDPVAGSGRRRSGVKDGGQSEDKSGGLKSYRSDPYVQSLFFPSLTLLRLL